MGLGEKQECPSRLCVNMVIILPQHHEFAGSQRALGWITVNVIVFTV
jgi:hypothetical protein